MVAGIAMSGVTINVMCFDEGVALAADKPSAKQAAVIAKAKAAIARGKLSKVSMQKLIADAPKAKTKQQRAAWVARSKWIAKHAVGSSLAAKASDEALKKAALDDLARELGIAALRQQVADLIKTLQEYEETVDNLKDLMGGGS